MGPSFSMASCGFARKPSTRYGARPSFFSARSSCDGRLLDARQRELVGLAPRVAGPEERDLRVHRLLMASVDLLVRRGRRSPSCRCGSRGRPSSAAPCRARISSASSIASAPPVGIEEGRVEDALLDVLDPLVRQGVDADELHRLRARPAWRRGRRRARRDRCGRRPDRSPAAWRAPTPSRCRALGSSQAMSAVKTILRSGCAGRSSPSRKPACRSCPGVEVIEPLELDDLALAAERLRRSTARPRGRSSRCRRR